MNLERLMEIINSPVYKLKDKEFGVMFVMEDEVRERAGLAADQELVSGICNLLTRLPDRSFWYNKRKMFNELIDEGLDVIRNNLEQDRISSANDELRDELGLGFFISLDYEVRPMRVINDFDDNMNGLPTLVEFPSGDGRSFLLPPQSRWSDLLTEIDIHLDCNGLFLEEVKYVRCTKNSTFSGENISETKIILSFGS